YCARGGLSRMNRPRPCRLHRHSRSPHLEMLMRRTSHLSVLTLTLIIAACGTGTPDTEPRGEEAAVSAPAPELAALEGSWTLVEESTLRSVAVDPVARTVTLANPGGGLTR